MGVEDGGWRRKNPVEVGGWRVEVEGRGRSRRSRTGGGQRGYYFQRPVGREREFLPYKKWRTLGLAFQSYKLHCDLDTYNLQEK